MLAEELSGWCIQRGLLLPCERGGTVLGVQYGEGGQRAPSVAFRYEAGAWFCKGARRAWLSLRQARQAHVGQLELGQLVVVVERSRLARLAAKFV